ADVDDEQGVRQGVHVLDAADGLVELFQFAIEHQGFFLAHALGDAFGQLSFHFLQALDRRLDRLEVGHHAAQPAAVDIRHAATSCFGGDKLARCALGADEKDIAAAGSNLANELGRFLILNDGLFQVDDVDLVTLAKDERSHLGVPVTGLVAKVDTGFQHFTHQRHNILQGFSLVPGLYRWFGARQYLVKRAASYTAKEPHDTLKLQGTRFTNYSASLKGNFKKAYNSTIFSPPNSSCHEYPSHRPIRSEQNARRLPGSRRHPGLPGAPCARRSHY